MTQNGSATGFLAKLDATDATDGAGGAVLSAQEIGALVSGGSVGNDGAVHLTGVLMTDASGEQFPTGETLISTPSYSLDIFVSKLEPGDPGIRSLAVSPEPVVQGDPLTLSAHGVLDIGGRVDNVAFYRDANNDGVPDVTEFLDTDSNVSGAWSLSVVTAGLAFGTHKFLAVATDNDGDTSEAVGAEIEVVEGVPTQPETYNSTDVPKTIADSHKKRGPRPAISLLTPSGTGTVVDTVTVDVTIAHAQAAGLTVSLTSPQDTAASLSYDDVNDEWQINESAFQNEDLDGTWQLTVTDTNRDGVTGTLQAWSMTVTPLAAAASSQSTASAVDQALLAWVDLDSTDDDSDILTQTLADDLALMLVG